MGVQAMHHGELREPTFFILASVAAQPLHGYAIKQAVDEMCGGRFQLTAGTLYTALERLAASGLVRETGSAVVRGRNRRYYVLTEQGAEVLAAEVTRLRSNATHGSDQLEMRSHSLGA